MVVLEVSLVSGFSGVVVVLMFLVEPLEVFSAVNIFAAGAATDLNE